MENFLALIETKMTYPNVNGKWGRVVEFLNDNVKLVVLEETQDNVIFHTLTFRLNEIKAIKPLTK